MIPLDNDDKWSVFEDCERNGGHVWFYDQDNTRGKFKWCQVCGYEEID